MTDPITDAELIRYLDGELTAVDRAAIDASPAATARLNALRQRSTRMSALLTTVNPTPAESRSSADRIRPQLENARRPRLGLSAPMKAAAAIALLLGFGMAIPPVRAMIVDWARQAAQTIGIGSRETPRADPPATEPAPEPPGAAVAVRFDVVADTFEVALSVSAGHLLIQRTQEMAGSAEATGVTGTNFMLSPRGLRIDGPASATAVYRILLPHHVKVVRIQRDGQVGRMADLTDSLRIELARE